MAEMMLTHSVEGWRCLVQFCAVGVSAEVLGSIKSKSTPGSPDCVVFFSGSLERNTSS